MISSQLFLDGSGTEDFLYMLDLEALLDLVEWIRVNNHRAYPSH